jgi:trimethylamine--corrinoid protein Co-methyltransferase
MHLRVAQGVKIDADHLAVDVIAKAMNGKDYFLQKHTIKHLRTGELYQPKVGLYGLFKQWEDEGALDMAARAREEVNSLLASHQDVPLPDEVEREFKRIIKAAEMELV